MASLPEPVRYSIESTQVGGRKPVIYNYERDIPTKIRPHYRHRLIITGDPAVTTIGNESPCPCQINLESMPTTPFATEELEKEFWSKLHHMMPQRDAKEEMDSQKWQRRQRRARELESAAKEGKKKGEKSAQETLTDSSDSDDRRDRERRQQRSGGGTAVESVAERAESDRKRREDEPRVVAIAEKFKIQGWIQESGKSP